MFYIFEQFFSFIETFKQIINQSDDQFAFVNSELMINIRIDTNLKAD